MTSTRRRDCRSAWIGSGAAVLCLALALAGCSDPMREFEARCGASNPSAEPDAPALVLRIVAGPEPHAGRGFCARAHRADGVFFEALSDASGTARLPIDPSAGPWDVTIARPSYAAVSIVGVMGPIPGAIYTEPVHEEPLRAEHVLYVTVDGVDGHASGWQAFDGTKPLQWVNFEDGSYAYEEFFVHDGPPFALSAVVPWLGLFSLPPIPREDRDMSVELTGPPAPLPEVLATEVTLHFPFAREGASTDAFVRFGRACDRRAWCLDAPYAPQPGYESLFVDATTARFSVSSYAAPLAPEVASRRLAVHGGGHTIDATVSIRELGAPVEIALRELGPASVEGRRPEEIRWSSDNADFDHAVLVLRQSFYGPGTGGSPGERPRETWRMWTYAGATFESLPLPTLPAGLVPDDLGGPGRFPSAEIVVFDAANDHPWSTRDPAGFSSIAQSP